MIDLAHQMAQHVDLARHFRAADHRCDRMCRIAERGVERLQFGLHRAPRISGKPARDALRSEEHTSELQSLMRISYAVFCLKKKTVSGRSWTDWIWNCDARTSQQHITS